MLTTSPLAVFLLLFCRCQAENSRQGVWRIVFTLDKLAPNASFSTTVDTKRRCELHCLQEESCVSLAFHQDSATCWLYPHLVQKNSAGLGSPAPGTSYFWPQPNCPARMGYILDAGICFKIYTLKANWTTADDNCHNDGGYLLIADTAAKRNAVLQVSKNHYYLGASDQVKEGEWRWSDGTLMEMVN